MVTNPLNIVLLDESAGDRNQIEAELRIAGFEPDTHLVLSEAAFVDALKHPIDAILSECRIADIDCVKALELLKARELDIPFIVVSGHVTDMSATQFMRAGAEDCVPKSRLARLGPVVSRALVQKRLRSRGKQASCETRQPALILDTSEDALISHNCHGMIETWNRAAQRLLGYTATEVIGSNISVLYPLLHRDPLSSSRQCLGDLREHPYEATLQHKNGTMLALSIDAKPLTAGQSETTGFVLHLRNMERQEKPVEKPIDRTALNQLLMSGAITTSTAEHAETALQQCLKLLCAYGNWSIGHGITLRCNVPGLICHVQNSIWETRNPENFRGLIAHAEQLDYARSSGAFIGRAILEKRPVWVADFREVNVVGRAEILDAHGIRSGLVLPLVVHDEVVALMELFADAPRPPDVALLEAIPNLLIPLACVFKRERAFETQQNNQAELDRMLGTLNEVVWSMDPRNGKLLYINEAVHQFTNHSVHDLIAYPRLWRKRLHNIDRLYVRNSIRRLLHDGSGIHRFRLVLDDGDVRTVSCSARVRYDATGKAVSIDGTLVDVTERTNAEKLRRRLYELARMQAALAAAANEALKPEEALQASLKLISQYGHWNVGHLTTFATVHGKRKVNTSLWQVEDAARFSALIEHSESVDDPELARFMGHPLSESETVWIEDLSAVSSGRSLVLAREAGLRSAFAFLVTVQHEPVAVLEFYTDDVRVVDPLFTENILNVAGQLARVIERARARETEARLAAIVASSQDAIVSSTTGGDILTWNPGAERMFGYTREEMIGKSLAIIVPEDLHAEVRQRRRHYLANGSLEPYESERVTKDGRRLFVSVSFSPINDESGHVVGFSTMYRDITARKLAENALRELNEELEEKVATRTEHLNRAREEAEEASRAKSMFLAAMSHEIRTPMNGVIGMIDVLHQSSLKADQLEMINLMRESAFSLLGIINDILDFSKIEAGKLEIEQEPFALMDVVEGVGSLLNGMAAKNKVTLTMFVDPKIPSQVMGDTLRVRQVITNVISNAIKFSSGQRRPGHVSVRVSLVEDTPQQATVAFRVSDNGVGMDEETQARLFSAFTQADVSTTRRFGGTGLGLAIAGHLVKLMGGHISVHSVLDQGATFTVRLPFVPLPSTGYVSDASFDVAGLSCVVVGDDTGVADDLAVYLKHARANVVRASTLESVVSTALTQDVQLVWVIDIGDGPRPLEELRAAFQAYPDPEIRHAGVLVERGQRRKPRAVLPDLVTLDCNALARRTLYQAVAIAAGRASLEPSIEALPKGKASTIAPLREEALKQQKLILVAEDNETNQKVIVRQLALLGYTADVAADGLQALQLWRSGEYNLLITDLHMPKMDGYELAQTIRRMEKEGEHIPIIALTANALKHEAAHCISLGMDDYQSKPMPLEHLKAMLEKWLRDTEKAPDDAALPNLEESIAEPSTTAVPVDVSALMSLVGDDSSVVIEFLQDFLESAAKIAAELRAAHASRQIDKAVSAAHKLKSSARAVGAFALGELCEAMEEEGKVDGVDAMSVLMPRFEAEMALVVNYLDQL